MKLTKSIFTAVFLLILSQLFGQTSRPSTQPTSQASKMPEEVIKKTDVYEVTYPADWNLDESGSMGTTFFLHSPSTSVDDNFSENINYLIQDATGFNLDLDSFTKLSVDQIKTLIPNSQIISNEKQTDKNGDTYQRIEYTGDQGGLNLYFIQHYYFVNDKAQLITFVAEEDEYDDYKDMAQRIISTIVRK